MTTPKPIADQLREAIAASGMSLNALSRMTDVNVATVHKFSHGGNISLETAEKLAQGLGLKVLKVPPLP